MSTTFTIRFDFGEYHPKNDILTGLGRGEAMQYAERCVRGEINVLFFAGNKPVKIHVEDPSHKVMTYSVS